MDVIATILCVILLIYFYKNIAKIFEKGEAFVTAFREVHEEIEQEAKTNPDATSFVFYDPYRHNR